MIARNYVDGTGHGPQLIDDVNDKLSAEAIVFESIARKVEKIGRFFSAYLGNASARVQSCCSYPIAEQPQLE
jgi:hypothetical protein